MKDGTYTIKNRDQAFKIEDGTPGNHLYGYHPVYLFPEESSYFNIILFRSTHAMDV
jgi:hypothetical protein